MCVRASICLSDLYFHMYVIIRIHKHTYLAYPDYSFILSLWVTGRHTYNMHTNKIHTYRLDANYNDLASMGYRDLCLNVEVGWTLQNGVVHFEQVKNWVDLECKTLICEIQGMYICMYIYACICYNLS